MQDDVSDKIVLTGKFKRFIYYRTRLVLFKMIIDIEHYLKIRILDTIEEIPEENGYKIVNLYLEKDFNDKECPKMVQ